MCKGAGLSYTEANVILGLLYEVRLNTKPTRPDITLPEGGCYVWPSLSRLGQTLQIDPSQANRVLQKLSKDGWLLIYPGHQGSNRPNVYDLAPFKHKMAEYASMSLRVVDAKKPSSKTMKVADLHRGVFDFLVSRDYVKNKEIMNLYFAHQHNKASCKSALMDGKASGLIDRDARLDEAVGRFLRIMDPNNQAMHFAYEDFKINKK